MERAIEKSVVVAAPLEDVWRAWTSTEGAETFFAPRARVELEIGGAYEMYFMTDAPEGQQGSEGCRILSYLPGRMLSFDWNAPPEFPDERKARTWVVVLLSDAGEGRTAVSLTHLGWKQGGHWDDVYAYFQRAWDVVIERLEHIYRVGPLDWNRPTRPG